MLDNVYGISLVEADINGRVLTEVKEYQQRESMGMKIGRRKFISAFICPLISNTFISVSYTHLTLPTT